MRVRKVVFGLASLAALVTALPSPSAAQIFASTRENETSFGQDLNWFVAALHGPFGGGTFGGAFLPAWGVPIMGDPGWISNNSTGSNGGIGNYMYFIFRQTFDLTGYSAASADLQFRWACDDVPGSGAVPWVPVFSLNGGTPSGGGTCGAYGFGAVVDLNSGFVDGVNTLDFYVEGNGQTDGLEVHRESFTAPLTPTDGVPEPASLVLTATGLLTLAGVLRRKKQ